MKIYAIIVTLFLTVGCVHLSNSSSVVDIDGTWRGEIKRKLAKLPEYETWRGDIKKEKDKTPTYTTMYLTFNFKREGDTVKGTVSNIRGLHIPGKWFPLEDIKIKGKEISFTAASMMRPVMKGPVETIEPMKIKTIYAGKIEGEKIKLSCKTKVLNIPMPNIPLSQLPNGPRKSKAYIRSMSRGAGDGGGGKIAGMGDNRINSGNQAGLSRGFFGVSIPDDEITLERISKVPENPLNY